MVESNKISSTSAGRAKGTGALLETAMKGIPPTLRRFYKFTKDMAQKFSRHLSKDRTDEFVEYVAKEFK